MSGQKNRARVYIYPKDCQPFQTSEDEDNALIIAMVCTILEPISVSDSMMGDGSYSIQFQSNCKGGQWAQGAFQFSPKMPTIFQLFESKDLMTEPGAIYSSRDSKNPLPAISGLELGWKFFIQLKEHPLNPSVLALFASIQDPSGNIVWDTKGDVPFAYFDEPIDANAVATGYGNGSTATFKAGRLGFQIVSPKSGLGHVQPNQLLNQDLDSQGRPATPCYPIRYPTGETENTGYDIVEEDQLGVGYEESLLM